MFTRRAAVLVTAFVGLLGVAFSPVSKATTTPDATAPAAASVIIAAAGDVACQPPYTETPDTCKHGATAKLITNRNPAAVLVLGDSQYEKGGLRAFRNSYKPTWGVFKTKTYPSPGNHEYGTEGAAGYFAYYRDRAGDPALGYYAYDLAGWRMYSLNSNCNKIDCAAQVTWLKNDLAANPRQCSLAYMHHPRYSSGDHGGVAMVNPLWPPLDNHDVDVILQGHDHSYERFGRMSASGGPSDDGIRSFVSGMGGKSRYPFGTVEPGSEFRYNAQFGVLFMTLRSTGYSWRFRTINGGTIRDSGSDTCVV